MTIKGRELTEQEKQAILKRDGYACRYCGTKEGPFQFDHVYPFSKGGETTIENMVTACLNCNSRKHNKVGMWPIPLTAMRQERKSPTLALIFILAGLACLSFPFAPSIVPLDISLSKGITLTGIVFILSGSLFLARWIKL